jgi:sarcosine/dimethylglycine N-methyltransferase
MTGELRSESVARHYEAGGPYEKVMAALEVLAPKGAPLALEQLATFEDFHTAGRMATARMAQLLAPAADELVLDAGSGIGGPARYLASQFGCRVIGLDLTPEFVAIANMLSERTGMTDRVECRVGDVTSTGLADESVDHCWTQHVAMNIADRKGFYAEMRRVTRPGGRFALFDVIDGGGGELLLPVPWATQPEHSHLVTKEELRTLVEGAGFRVDVWDDPTAEMLDMMRSMTAPPPGSQPPPLNPTILIDDFPTKSASYMTNMAEGRTALLLAVCTAI